jgi:uncharacterized OsmC-like protein
VNGRADAFNPAELLLAAIAACMIKGIERIAPINHFAYRGVDRKVRFGRDYCRASSGRDVRPYMRIARHAENCLESL